MYRAKHRRTHEPLAVNVIPFSDREVGMVRTLVESLEAVGTHKNILAYKGAYETKSDWHIVTEWYETPRFVIECVNARQGGNGGAVGACARAP